MRQVSAQSAVGVSSTSSGPLNLMPRTIRRAMRSTIVLGIAVVVVGLSAAPAAANSIHAYETSWNMPAGSQPTPQAVDTAGNVYVYNEGTSTVSRFDSNGNPVPFPALGTNMIDGEGGSSCPSVPTDCDRVPLGRLYQADHSHTHQPTLAVDTTNGPAAGYIYVENAGTGARGAETTGYPNATTEVFSPSGEFIGEVNSNVDVPGHIENYPATVNVDQYGNIYLNFYNGFGTHIMDKFVPVDGNPAHDVFAGQIRAGWPEGIQDGLIGGSDGAGGFPHSWVIAGPTGPIYAFDQAEFHTIRRNRGGYTYYSDPLLTPLISPGDEFERSANEDDGITLDPSTGHVYLRHYNQISEWDGEGHQVGNLFGPGHVFVFGPGENVAVDGSQQPTRGRVYAQGSQNGNDSVAVFSPPLPTPDVKYTASTVGHDSAHIEGEVQIVAGLKVTDCKLEWKLSTSPHTYYDEQPLPCTPAPPYLGDQQVSVDLNNLVTEQKISYRIAATNINGVSYGERREIQPHAVLDLTTEKPTNISTNQVTLNASLNPDGMETHYYFEYGLDAQYGQKTVEADAPQDGGPQSVPGVDATKLQPGMKYHYRAVAYNTLGTTYGEDQIFIPGAPPKISAVRARNVSATDADLHAIIDPVESATTYRFEYGVSLSYGKDAATGSIPPDVESAPVSVHLAGLQPGVTYYFRVIAENSYGTTVGEDTSFTFSPPACPNSQVRRQTGANYLPDCRGYELVTPADAGQAYILPGDSVFDWAHRTFSFGPEQGLSLRAYPQNRGVSMDPARFNFYATLSGLPGLNTPNLSPDMYVSTRAANGWKTTYPGLTADQVFTTGRTQCSLSLDKCMTRPSAYLAYPGGFEEYVPPYSEYSNSPFLFDSSDGKLLGRLPTNVAAVQGGLGFTGEGRASGDFSHFVFTSLDVPFAPGGNTGPPGTVYDNDLETGAVTIISKLPNGEPIPQDPANAGDPADYLDVPFISSDASRILIGARTEPRCFGWLTYFCPVPDPNTPLRLYMRNAGATMAVSEDKPVRLADVALDGKKVYFTSPEQFDAADTDTSVDLYEWDEETQDISLLSIGPDGTGNSDDCSVAWVEGCGVEPLRSCRAVWTVDLCEAKSEWGFPTQRPDIDNGTDSTSGATLFYSPEQLDPANPGVRNARNLYLLYGGVPHYVTTFSPGATAERYNVSADGLHVAFLTTARLTGYDNTAAPGVSCQVAVDSNVGSPDSLCREVYRFDTATGILRCMSCNPDGGRPVGDAIVANAGPFMSDDGRVFFSTRDALAPPDTDGMYDVYEYVEGHPQLISSGTTVQDRFPGLLNFTAIGFIFDPSYAGLESVSSDGRDVFFSTYDTLVPEDKNGRFLKVYDARTNGGFPYRVAALPCKAPDECHDPTDVGPAEPEVGSGATLAGGNLTKAKAKKKKARKHARKARKRHAAAHDKRSHGR